MIILKSTIITFLLYDYFMYVGYQNNTCIFMHFTVYLYIIILREDLQ